VTTLLRPAAGQQVGQQFGVVLHFQIPAVPRIVVLEDVVAVRRHGNQAAHAQFLEELQIVFGEHLEQPRLAQPSHLAAATLFLFAQDAEAQAGAFEGADQGDRRGVNARIVGWRAAYEVQEVRLVSQVGDALDLQVAHPRRPIGAGEGERVALSEDRLQRHLDCGGNAAALYQRTAHAHDDLHGIHVLWTAGRAGVAGGAIPEHLDIREVEAAAGNQRAIDELADVELRLQGHWAAARALAALDTTVQIEFPGELANLYLHIWVSMASKTVYRCADAVGSEPVGIRHSTSLPTRQPTNPTTC
jgi:hypothetical protein